MKKQNQKEEETEKDQFRENLKNKKKLLDSSIDTYIVYYDSLIKEYKELVPKLAKEKNIIPELSQDLIEAFIIKHKNNFAVRGFVRAYLKFRALDKDIFLPDTPTGSKKTRIYRNITLEQIQAMKKYLYNKDYQSGLIFDLIVQGGLRLSEILKVKINSFDWNSWIANPTKKGHLIISGKGRKEREVLVHPDTMQEMFNRLVLKTPEADLDFLINQDLLLIANITKIKVYELIKKSSIKAIGRDVRPHELRFFRANELLKNGVDILDIKNYLGHSSVRTTEIYLSSDTKKSLENIEEKEVLI